MQKKSIPFLILLIGAFGLFGLGFYGGRHFSTPDRDRTVLLQQEISDASEAARWLQRLRRGEEADVIEELAVELELSIVTIGRILEEASVDSETRQLAYATLDRIGRTLETSFSNHKIEPLNLEAERILEHAQRSLEREGITNRGSEQREAAPPERSP